MRKLYSILLATALLSVSALVVPIDGKAGPPGQAVSKADVITVQNAPAFEIQTAALQTEACDLPSMPATSHDYCLVNQMAPADNSAPMPKEGDERSRVSANLIVKLHYPIKAIDPVPRE